MKIKVNMDNLVEFDLLEFGDIFKNSEGDYLMKINDPTRNIEFPVILNAVYLETGELTYIHPNDEIQVIDDYIMEFNE